MSEPTIASFCTGYGGLDDAVRRVFGGHLVSWSDIAEGPIKVMQRHAPGVPNLGSVKDINWFRHSTVDIFTAGYPCQPFSNAGLRLGTDTPGLSRPAQLALLGNGVVPQQAEAAIRHLARVLAR